MKLVLFGEEFSLGILSGDSVIDASSVADAISHHSPQELMSGLIAGFDRHRGALEQLAGGGQRIPAGSVRLRAPLPCPPRLVCMAVNYLEHDDQIEPAPINRLQQVLRQRHWQRRHHSAAERARHSIRTRGGSLAWSSANAPAPSGRRTPTTTYSDTSTSWTCPAGA